MNNLTISHEMQEKDKEITRLQAMVDLSKSIIEEKGNQIRLYKEATGDLPLYQVRERITDRALKNAQDTIDRLSSQILELREVRDSRIDTLESLLQRQRDRIAALESNPTNEESRFNIERQYEREMTNVTHLTGQIFNLEYDKKSLTWKVRTLESQVEILKAQRDSIQRMYEDYKERYPDEERVFQILQEEAKAVADSPWKKYHSPRSESIMQMAENYLRSLEKSDS